MRFFFKYPKLSFKTKSHKALDANGNCCLSTINASILNAYGCLRKKICIINAHNPSQFLLICRIAFITKYDKCHQHLYTFGQTSYRVRNTPRFYIAERQVCQPWQQVAQARCVLFARLDINISRPSRKDCVALLAHASEQDIVISSQCVLSKR